MIAPQAFAPFGAGTPFGRLFLDPAGSIRATPIPTTGGTPNEVNLGALLDPASARTTIGLQALARNTAAPAGGAFSNPLEVRVLP